MSPKSGLCPFNKNDTCVTTNVHRECPQCGDHCWDCCSSCYSVDCKGQLPPTNTVKPGDEGWYDLPD